MSEHLDFNTDFLGKSTPAKRGGGSTPGPSKPNKWKPWFIGGGIVLIVIILAAASGSSSSPSTSASSNSTYPTPTSNSSGNSSNQVKVGQFMCSSYNASRADSLQPDIPEATIQAESDALDVRIAALKAQKTRIDNMYVDNTDQSSLDTYNAQVDSFNVANNRLNADIDAYQAKLPHYNAQVNAYNSFLQNNCTPA